MAWGEPRQSWLHFVRVVNAVDGPSKLTVKRRSKWATVPKVIKDH